MTKVTWRPDEPGRDKLYRKVLTRIRTQDDIITHLLNQIKQLQKRIEALEKPCDMT